VNLLEDDGRTPPNHSRLAFCLAEVDFDADDRPEHDPQKGQ
jgi:hypothetical protein